MVSLAFDIEPTESSIAVRLAREHRAEAISVARLVAPESVVVVGAGRDPASLGHRLLRHLLEGGFTGPRVGGEPAAAEAGQQVLGVPTYASVTRGARARRARRLVAVPADEVHGRRRRLRRRRAWPGCSWSRAATPRPARTASRASAQLVRRARGNGMRVIGPNALGIVNTDPEVSLNASLAPRMPGRAPIGFFCQSGSLGGTILARAVRRGLGVSTFVSAGNRADVSGNDLLQFWEDDEQTDGRAALPREPRQPAQVHPRRAPPLAQQAGGGDAHRPLHAGLPARATRSGARRCRPRRSTRCSRSPGVIETDSLGELFDVAGLLAFQPLPLGRKRRHRRQLRRARRARRRTRARAPTSTWSATP